MNKLLLGWLIFFAPLANAASEPFDIEVFFHQGDEIGPEGQGVISCESIEAFPKAEFRKPGDDYFLTEVLVQIPIVRDAWNENSYHLDKEVLYGKKVDIPRSFIIEFRKRVFSAEGEFKKSIADKQLYAAEMDIRASTRVGLMDPSFLMLEMGTRGADNEYVPAVFLKAHGSNYEYGIQFSFLDQWNQFGFPEVRLATAPIKDEKGRYRDAIHCELKFDSKSD